MSQEATKGGEQQHSAEWELSQRTLVLSPNTSKANTKKMFQVEVLRVFCGSSFLGYFISLGFDVVALRQGLM